MTGLLNRSGKRTDCGIVSSFNANASVCRRSVWQRLSTMRRRLCLYGNRPLRESSGLTTAESSFRCAANARLSCKRGSQSGDRGAPYGSITTWTTSRFDGTLKCRACVLPEQPSFNDRPAVQRFLWLRADEAAQRRERREDWVNALAGSTSGNRTPSGDDDVSRVTATPRRTVPSINP